MPPRDIDPDRLAMAIAKGLADYDRQSGGAIATATAFKHNATGTPVTTGFAHGSGGLLTYPGVHPDVYQTIVGDVPGILDLIPWVGSVFTHEVYEVLTGVQAGSGAEKNAVCDPAPIGGLLKGGKHWAPFGRYSRQTVEMEVNRLGQRLNSADPDYLRLVGAPIGGASQFMPIALGGDVLQNEVAKRKFELAVAFHRLLAQQAWNGNPTNNSAGGGYKEFQGLAMLINTGYRDAETAALLPSLDSDVKAYGYGRIDGSLVNTQSIINQLTYMYRTRRSLAERTGVAPVRFILAMKEVLFYELTKVWPCGYLTNVCSVNSSGNVINLDARDITNFRDGMRGGRYLMIDGDQVPVVFDDGITENSNTTSASVPSGCFASDIYLIPLTIMGGKPVLYGEYFDYNNPSSRAAIAMDPTIYTNGMFLQWVQRTRNCILWQLEIEPRIVLRTPWLAGRITNVAYCPLQHTRDPFPSQPYFLNGGETARTGPSLYGLF